MRMTLAEIMDASEASTGCSSAPYEMYGRMDEIVVTGVSTDTRTLQSGDLYIALQGEKSDGHEYVAVAFEKGAVAAVVNSDKLASLERVEAFLLGRPNTQVAYGEIARAWRRKFDTPVIGVTGSVGKTTTKEMLAASLSPLGPVLKTAKNENNEIGVPKLLLQLDESHKAAIVEMGMRGAGQIEYLAKIAEPHIGVISRIGENHIELLGSLDAIADAKGELLEALPENGIAVLNADDPYLPRLMEKVRCPVATYGFSEGATLQAVEAEPDATGESWHAAVRHSDGQIARLRVPSPSRHDVSNALAAVLTAVSCGVPLQAACDALEQYQNVGMRMEILKSPNGATILSDCYNAAPTSVRSALDTLASFPSTSGRRVAFLGDMRELGEFAPGMHAEVVAHAEVLHLSELYAVGPVSSAQMTRADRSFADSAEAAGWAAANLGAQSGDVVLVKGSRALAMERIVAALAS